MIFLGTLFLGFLVALSSVFLGIGGGILLVPLMPSLFQISIHQSVATSVTTIFLVVALNSYFFQKDRLIHWPVVFLMGPPSAVAAFLAARLSQSVNSQVILWALAALLMVVVGRNVLSSFLRKDYEVRPFLDRRTQAFAIGGGIFAGMGSGFAGIGSGAILSPLMIILRIIAPEKLSPTANANMLFTTAAASLSFFVSGEPSAAWEWGLIRLDIALGLFVAAQLFAIVLRPQQNRLPFSWKSTILNVLLFLLIVKITYMSMAS